jgi:hypothetical protein
VGAFAAEGRAGPVSVLDPRAAAAVQLAAMALAVIAVIAVLAILCAWAGGSGA